MPRSTRHKYGTVDHSRVIFAILVMSMLVVGVFLTAASDSDVAADDEAQPKGMSAGLPQATPTTTPVALNKIVFFSQMGNPNVIWRLHSMDPDGTNVFTYTTLGTVPYSPDISSDGTLIVYGSEVSGSDTIVMNVDGTNEHIIDTQVFGDFVGGFAWSPNHSKIAYSRHIDSEHTRSIFVMNADGSNKQRLTTGPAGGDGSPSWSPDGTKIAFERTASQLLVMNANGSNQHAIITGTVQFPQWSPDGTLIAYFGDSGLISVVNPDGTNPHLIPNVPASITSEALTWSPDGNSIAFSTNYDIYKINLDGSGFYTLTDTPSRAEFGPSWGGPVLPKVVVEGADELPVPGAQVFRNCDLVGTTNLSGTLMLTGPLTLGDDLIARAAVYTGTTQKGGHDGWAYEVWLTNILQNNDGTESPYTVTDTNRLLHTLVLLPTNAQIGFNLVASVEYNTTTEHLGQIEAGFKSASEYLMDVTDGQMFFGKVKLYEEGQHFNDADFKFHSWNPRANADIEPDGISALTSANQYIHMSGPDTFGVPYNQVDAYTTLIHEFGHYAVGAYDEYYKWNADDYPASCTLNRDDVEYNIRASIMENQRNSSEFCATISPIVHNDDTAQGYIQGESVWETLVDNWSSDEELWELRSPMTRGEVNKGPIFVSCPVTLGTQVEIVNVPGGACPPFGITADMSNGDPAVGADITVKHGNTYYYLGTIDTAGIGTVVGGSVGDTVMVSLFLNGVSYNARAVINSCHSIALVLTAGIPPQEGDSAGTWPVYWVTAVPDWSLNRVDITLHMAGDSPGTPALYASQGGNNRQAVALTYNAGQFEYTGAYTFSANFSPDFKFELELPVTGGFISSVYDFLGGQFHNTGPAGYEKMKNVGIPHGKDPSLAPVAWGLLRPESMADIVVEPSSLPNGTGVMVGKSGMPADRPNNLVQVGGPYSVQGQNPISGEIGITLSYLSEHYCGLQPGSTSIYRYTGTGWEAITTNLIDEWHQVGGKITEWGIYGVFAQPNAQTTFSDVPTGSTFYDYIRWMTCHGIASGYSDDTFRPNNNATRGQISKMISLAYQWYLEPPANGYTFTDVLPGSTFYLYVEAAYREGVVSGYPCGSPGEPCDAQNRPYFRPSNNVTRGQIAKIISNGSKFNDPVSGQTFEDVPAGSTFHEFVERMAARAIINGYACGGPGEPCVPPGNRPYFRPSANATRGQLSKMIYLAASPR